MVAGIVLSVCEVSLYVFWGAQLSQILNCKNCDMLVVLIRRIEFESEAIKIWGVESVMCVQYLD
jgi:hypothetical protein